MYCLPRRVTFVDIKLKTLQFSTSPWQRGFHFEKHVATSPHYEGWRDKRPLTDPSIPLKLRVSETAPYGL